MTYKRELRIINEAGEEIYTYYVNSHYSEEFDCEMYNVGIRSKVSQKEIEDFSPDINEAKELCDYLYNENVSANNLFSVAEEFIVTL